MNNTTTDLNAGADEDWYTEMFGPYEPTTPEQAEADRAYDARILAAMGLTRGQVVSYDGDECVVVGAASATCVSLYDKTPERLGFLTVKVTDTDLLAWAAAPSTVESAENRARAVRAAAEAARAARGAWRA